MPSKVRAMYHSSTAILGIIFLIAGVREKILYWAVLIVAPIIAFIFDGVRNFVRKRIEAKRINGVILSELADLYNKGMAYSLRTESIRPYEIKGVSAVTHFSVGIIISMIFFGFMPTLWGIIVLGFGDPTARHIGIKEPIYRFKSWLWKGQSIGGALGFIFVNIGVFLIADMLFLYFRPEYFKIQYIWMQLIVIIAGAITELVSRKKDNAFIPIVSGFIAWLLL
jgi:dolichol kinase